MIFIRRSHAKISVASCKLTVKIIRLSGFTIGNREIEATEVKPWHLQTHPKVLQLF